jgi:hypothetical protein
MQITISDEEYAWLAAVAKQTGQSVEALVRAAVAEVAQRYAPPPAATPQQDPLIAYMRSLGHILPTTSEPEGPDEGHLPPYGSDQEDRVLTEAGTAAAAAAKAMGLTSVELVREDRDCPRRCP